MIRTGDGAARGCIRSPPGTMRDCLSSAIRGRRRRTDHRAGSGARSRATMILRDAGVTGVFGAIFAPPATAKNRAWLQLTPVWTNQPWRDGCGPAPRSARKWACGVGVRRGAPLGARARALVRRRWRRSPESPPLARLRRRVVHGCGPAEKAHRGALRDACAFSPRLARSIARSNQRSFFLLLATAAATGGRRCHWPAPRSGQSLSLSAALACASWSRLSVRRRRDPTSSISRLGHPVRSS